MILILTRVRSCFTIHASQLPTRGYRSYSLSLRPSCKYHNKMRQRPKLRRSYIISVVLQSYRKFDESSLLSISAFSLLIHWIHGAF